MINIESWCIETMNVFKWIGCIMIILGCSGMGFSKSRDLQLHLKELEEIKKIFSLIRSELHYTREPFEEVFEKIARKTTTPYRNWLTQLSQKLTKKTKSSFWEIWCMSIIEDLYGSRLKEDELEELKNVGKCLEYMESLDLYIEQMEYKINNTRETYKSKKKICQSMGVMGGVFLVILFL